MAQITAVLRHSWLAYWRTVNRSSVAAGGQIILLLLTVLAFFRYLQFLQVASAELKNGVTIMLEWLLVGIFLAWLFPLFGTGGGGGLGADLRKLLHYPLSPLKLFFIRAFSFFFQPSAWLITIGSLAIFYPLAAAPNRAAGMFAGLLFVILSWSGGLTLVGLAALSGKRFGIALFAALGATGFYALKGGGLQGLSGLSSYLPHKLVSAAACGNREWFALGTLLGLAALCCGAAAFVFRKSLGRADSSRSQRIRTFERFRIFGVAGVLAAKDLRYFRRLLDWYVGLAISALCGAYLTLARAPRLGVVQFSIVFIILFNAALAFNCFGFDGRNGLDRCALSPLAGRTILFAKNLAFFAAAGLQLCLLTLPSVWRLGAANTAFLAAQAIASALVFATYGNWLSMRYPYRLSFYNFSSSRSPIDEVPGVALGLSPAGIVIFLSHRTDSLSASLIAPLLILCLASYFASLARGGRCFERERESLTRFL